jgi:xanthosine utilization system XapX-like protein
VLKPQATATSWLQHQVKPHVFGELPQCAKTDAATPIDAAAAPRKDA